MSKLKVPSLQHLARIWRPDPVAIKRVLVGLTKHGPTFSYAPLYEIVRDMLVFKVPYETVIEGINRIKRDDVRENFLGLLPLIREHFGEVRANFVHDVAPRFYSVGRGLMVPFQPPLVYGAGSELHFPWFSFWRSNPLAGDSLSLFVTIVEEVLSQDSDLESANFSILDFSAPRPGAPRSLTIVPASKIPRISQEKKIEMLQAFAEGYRLAWEEVNSGHKSSETVDRSQDSERSGQLPLL